MKTNKNKMYAVLGLGRYGQAVARELVENGVEVIAVDRDEEVVNMLSAELPFCRCADITDTEALKQLGIADVDVVVISMASNFEASVMATVLVKELGVKKVIVKCASDMACSILSKVGADQVVFPEKESGVRLARKLISAGMVDIVELSRDISMVEMKVLPEWVGKSLKELNLRKRYGINVAALIQSGSVSITVDPDRPLKESMRLIVIAQTDKLNRLL